MKLNSKTLLSIGFVSLFTTRVASAETYGFRDREPRRKLNIVREYQIPVQKGTKTVAAIPALMSFWGATNEQVIKASEFYYSVKPDKIEITADDLGMPRRDYELTWNAPQVANITVRQKLVVELACRNTLYTAAKLPYPDEVSKCFAASLGPNEKEGINPDNPELAAICRQIQQKSRYAEDAVELVCDWINENIEFKIKSTSTSDQIFAQKQGSCTSMSKLACAMLRHMGIPAEVINAKFIGSDNAHTFIEAYFPDAGWVFYDLSNSERGHKSLDCLMTVGWAFRVKPPAEGRWINGHFSMEKDMISFQKEPKLNRMALRQGPKGQEVVGVKVIKSKPSQYAKVRHLPISQIILNTAIPPSKRTYISSGTKAAK